MSRGILAAHRQRHREQHDPHRQSPVDPALIGELKASRLGVGLHVNLTLGAPLARPERVPSLVDAPGRVRSRRPGGGRPGPRRRGAHRDRQPDRRLSRTDGPLSDPPRQPPPRRPPLPGAGGRARLRAGPRDFPCAARTTPSGRRRAASTCGRPTTSWGNPAPSAYWSADRVLAHLRALPAGTSGVHDPSRLLRRRPRLQPLREQRETELAGLTDPRAREMIGAAGREADPLRRAVRGALVEGARRPLGGLSGGGTRGSARPGSVRSHRSSWPRPRDRRGRRPPPPDRRLGLGRAGSAGRLPRSRGRGP